MSVQVQEDYRDFSPPTGTRKRIELLLSRLPPSMVQGLGSVLLTNRGALSRDGRRHKTWSRGKKVPLAESRASYHQAWKGQPAWIRILVDNTLADIPAWAARLPMVETLCLATVLYHEVGHHIHQTSQPEHREREQVADEWSRRLTRKLLFERYWYVALPMAPVLAMMRHLLKGRLHLPRTRPSRP